MTPDPFFWPTAAGALHWFSTDEPMKFFCNSHPSVQFLSYNSLMSSIPIFRAAQLGLDARLHQRPLRICENDGRRHEKHCVKAWETVLSHFWE